MKKINKLKKPAVLAALLLVFIMPMAIAQEEAAEEDTGITPDSALYGLDKALDRLSLALTFDKAKRAEKGLKIADERLLEVKKMIEEGKDKEALEAQAGHDSAIQDAENSVNEIESDTNPEKAKEAIGKVAKIQNATESHYEKVAAIKDAILEMQREKMTPEQIAHLEAVFQKIKDKAKEMETKADQKKENAKTKYKALANKTDKEVDEEEARIDEAAGLARGRQDRADKAIKNAEEAIKKAKEKLKEEKAKGTPTAEIEQKLAEAEAQIKNAKTAREMNKGRNAAEIAEELKEYGNEISALATQLGDARKAGNFSAVFAQLKEAIKQRQIEHMNIVLEKVSEQAKASIQKVIERAENRTIKVPEGNLKNSSKNQNKTEG